MRATDATTDPTPSWEHGSADPASHRLDLTESSLERIADRLKVLGDATRLRLLAELQDGEICVGDLAGQVGGSQANVSKHLAVLRKAGLVTCRRDGMNVCYSMADPSVFQICHTVLHALADQAGREAEELRAACGEPTGSL